MQLTYQGFEPCPHCRDIYFFYVDSAAPPHTFFTAMPCRCRREAFTILEEVRRYSKIPMTDEQYCEIGRRIAESTLPEAMPDENVLKTQYQTHLRNPAVWREVFELVNVVCEATHNLIRPQDLN